METNLKKIISNNIKQYMAFYGITQLELANKLGVNQSTISLWINGEREPRMSKIDELCKIFDCTREDFISRIQEPSSIKSADKIGQLHSQISKLNEAGINKVCDYINDLSDKYFK